MPFGLDRMRLVMSPKKLILTPFHKALSSLEAILKLEKNEVQRDATIQRFKHCYEMAWKMMKRHLEWVGTTDVNLYSKRDLFREAAKAGLLSNPEAWFEYNDARNLTSHAYEESAAEQVYAMAKKIFVDAKDLLTKLQKHHA